MFKMDIDSTKKVFSIYAAGFFSMQEGMDFMKEYQTKTSQINANDYTLVVDGREVKTSAQDVAEQLKNMIMLYMSVPFKKRILIQQQSAVASSQTNRLFREIQGAETIIFVGTLEEAQSKI